MVSSVRPIVEVVNTFIGAPTDFDSWVIPSMGTITRDGRRTYRVFSRPPVAPRVWLRALAIERHRGLTLMSELLRSGADFDTSDRVLAGLDVDAMIFTLWDEIRWGANRFDESEPVHQPTAEPLDDLEPTPLPEPPVEQRPLVSQLVDVLDAGPAPPADDVVAELLAA